MLGRFRMTVPDCLREYETLGNTVFGHPRFFSLHRFKVGSRPKYKAARLEDAVRDVTKRRSEFRNYGEASQASLPLSEGVCQV